MSEEKHKVEITDYPFGTMILFVILTVSTCEMKGDVDRLADTTAAQSSMSCSISRNGVTYTGVEVCRTVANVLREQRKGQ